jgi:hypothetical protein
VPNGTTGILKSSREAARQRLAVGGSECSLPDLGQPLLVGRRIEHAYLGEGGHLDPVLRVQLAEKGVRRRLRSRTAKPPASPLEHEGDDGDQDNRCEDDEVGGHVVSLGIARGGSALSPSRLRSFFLVRHSDVRTVMTLRPISWAISVGVRFSM